MKKTLMARKTSRNFEDMGTDDGCIAEPKTNGDYVLYDLYGYLSDLPISSQACGRDDRRSGDAG